MTGVGGADTEHRIIIILYQELKFQTRKAPPRHFNSIVFFMCVLGERCCGRSPLFKALISFLLGKQINRHYI